MTKTENIENNHSWPTRATRHTGMISSYLKVHGTLSNYHETGIIWSIELYDFYGKINSSGAMCED